MQARPEAEARGTLSVRTEIEWFSSMEWKFQRRGGKTELYRSTGKWDPLSLFPTLAHGSLYLLLVI